jgi:phospholipase D1/2
VAMEEQGETTVWDVFLFDQDFKIERPPRYYRQGLNLLAGHPDGMGSGKEANGDAADPGEAHVPGGGAGRHTVKGTIRHGLKKALRLGHRRRHSDPQVNGNARLNGTGQRAGDDETSSSSSSSDSESEVSTVHRNMLDPSTNTNPLRDGQDDREGMEDLAQAQAQADSNGNPIAAVNGKKEGEEKKKGKKKRSSQDASKHTFYIENSQMRLKLYAKNEVSRRSI